jgi:hypothetical protein
VGQLGGGKEAAKIRKNRDAAKAAFYVIFLHWPLSQFATAFGSKRTHEPTLKDVNDDLRNGEDRGKLCRGHRAAKLFDSLGQGERLFFGRRFSTKSLIVNAQ